MGNYVMNTKQTEIYQGLKSIGEEIASFYADGVEMINSDYKTKSYLIAHISREIDGGLRDLLTKDEDKKVVQNALSNDELKDLKDKKGHIASILTALDVNFNSDFAKNWITVATEFVGFAHRHGAYKNTRKPEQIIELWNKYENILSYLIGNYLNILDRVDRIIQYDEPTKEIIETLPNLLVHQSRYFYFFNNLKSIKWFKPLFDKGYFKGNNNPAPIEVKDKPGYFSIPYWAELTYLKEVAQHNFNNPNNEITLLLTKTIDNIISYRNEELKRIENYHTDYSVLQMIGFLPIDTIKNEYFEFIQTALISQFNNSVIASEIGKSLLKRFILEKNKELIIKTLKVVLSYTKIGNRLDLYPLMSEFWLRETLNQYKNKILDLFPNEVFELAINYINEISEKEKRSFNSLSIPAIEDHSQTMFPEKYECQLIYLVRDALLKISEPEIKSIVSKLIRSNRISTRLGIYTINQRYDILSDIFWKWKDNPLNEDIEYKHELFELFKNHAKDFAEEQLQLIVKWIEEKEYWVSEENKLDKDLSEKIIAYKKRDWLTSLLETKKPIIQEKYDKYHNLNPIENKHPGFDSWYSGIVGSTSPLSKEEVLSKSLDENVNYFISFSKENKDFMGPSLEGLSDTIIEAIKDKPSLFIENCTSLATTPIYFLYTWMRGLNESWSSGKVFKVIEILKTALNIIQEPKFWELNNSEKRAYENNFISELTRFIEAGVQNDKHAFNSSNLPLIKKILLQICHNDKKKIFDYNELSMTCLNTTKGKTYSAIILYSLKFARDNKEKKNKWDDQIRKEIEYKLNGGETDELLFFTFGKFYRHLLFIDHDWTIENFNRLFSTENKVNFEATLAGYFFYNANVYRDIFNFFNSNKIYKNALNAELNNERSEVKRNIVNHICIALTSGLIDIDNELIEILLLKEKKHLFSYLHFFFWNEKHHSEEIEKQIKPLWKKIYTKFMKEKESIKKDYLGKTILWIENISEIDDEIYEWTKDSICFVDDSYYFIKALNKHIKNSTEKVANLMLFLFENKIEYGISRGLIQEMVKKIYEKGFKEQADKICILHAEKGNNMLRDIYKQYN